LETARQQIGGRSLAEILGLVQARESGKLPGGNRDKDLQHRVEQRDPAL
jgi:hypothetical protein